MRLMRGGRPHSLHTDGPQYQVPEILNVSLQFKPLWVLIQGSRQRQVEAPGSAIREKSKLCAKKVLFITI